MGETDLHLVGQQSNRGETKRGRQRWRDGGRDGGAGTESEHRDRDGPGGKAEPERGSRRGATLRPALHLRTHP